MTRKNSQDLVAFCVLMATLFMVVAIFGRSDWIAAVLFLGVWAAVFSSSYAMRMAVRNSVRAYFQAGTSIHDFFSREKSVPQLALAAALSFFLTVAFFIFIKMTWISHGWVGFSVAFMVSSMICIKVLSSYGGTLDRRFLAQDAQSDFSLATFIVLVVAANTFLALIFSARDLYGFLNAGVDFGDFLSYAEGLSIGRTDYNQLTRALINISIIADSFKLAMASELLHAFDFSVDGRSGNAYYVFYITVLGLNLASLVPVSVGLVLIAQYFHRVAAPVLVDRVMKHAGLLKAIKWPFRRKAQSAEGSDEKQT